ncbi:MAG: TIM barrel protein [archaeon]
MKIYLGPAGTPKASTLKGVEYIHDVGLKAMEVEFVYGIKMTNKTAKEVGEKAKELGMQLSVHAPYYINLASADAKIRTASKKRILTACERAHHLGAEFVVFHPGYYYKGNKEETFKIIKEAMIDIKKVVSKNKWKVKLAPETTGKVNVFGSLSETTNLVKSVKCSLCVDFAHILAREGRIDYNEVIRGIKKLKLKHYHFHFSGIEYGPKGERNHKITEPRQMKELAKAIIKNKLNCTVINESPDPVGDSLKMKKYFNKPFKD